ncbi:MAG: helix-turn-helix transcriptional regulator [Thermoanaerobaculia bacterium]
MSESKEARKAARLERAGWKTVTVQGFLGLSDDDMAIIEVKVALAKRLRAQRTRAGLSQVEVAKIVRSSQPRVAKMEAADKTVSIDLLVKALVKTGVSVQEIGRSLERIKPSKGKPNRAPRLAHA